MALNRKEADMLDRYVTAVQAAREYLEPHPSWKREQLRANALVAIEKACGGSPGLDAIYDEARALIAKAEGR